MNIDTALALVENEVRAATALHGPMHSQHEGYAVILEEVDELWDEIKKNPLKHPSTKQRRRQEAIQVAAMAIRFLIDTCE